MPTTMGIDPCSGSSEPGQSNLMAKLAVGLLWEIDALLIETQKLFEHGFGLLGFYLS